MFERYGKNLRANEREREREREMQTMRLNFFARCHNITLQKIIRKG